MGTEEVSPDPPRRVSAGRSAGPSGRGADKPGGPGPDRLGRDPERTGRVEAPQGPEAGRGGERLAENQTDAPPAANQWIELRPAPPRAAGRRLARLRDRPTPSLHRVESRLRRTRRGPRTGFSHRSYGLDDGGVRARARRRRAYPRRAQRPAAPDEDPGPHARRARSRGARRRLRDRHLGRSELGLGAKGEPSELAGSSLLAIRRGGRLPRPRSTTSSGSAAGSTTAGGSHLPGGRSRFSPPTTRRQRHCVQKPSWPPGSRPR